MPGIFTPLQIKGKTLKNRIVMGAAERVGFTYEDGLMGEDVIQEWVIVSCVRIKCVQKNLMLSISSRMMSKYRTPLRLSGRLCNT